MNDESLKRTEITREGSDGSPVKRHHATFFGADVEKQVSTFKSELSSQTNVVAECVKIEYAEIKRLFNQKVSERTDEPSFEKELVNYLGRIRFLSQICHVLKRIQPCCEVIDTSLLPAINVALRKIRLSFGCDLNNPETWKVAHIHTSKICEEATKLEISKLKLSKLYGYVFDDMEWFILSYKAADSENKRKFFAEMNENPQLLAWVQPWIDLAEGKKINWEQALSKAIESLSVAHLVTEKRVYE